MRDCHMSKIAFLGMLGSKEIDKAMSDDWHSECGTFKSIKSLSTFDLAREKGTVAEICE